MKTILSAAVCAIALVSAPAFASKDLATAKGCLGCHGIEKAGVMGPAYRDVAKKYEGQKDVEGKLAAFILNFDRALEVRRLGLHVRHAAFGIWLKPQPELRMRCRVRVQMADGLQCLDPDDFERIDPKIDRRAGRHGGNFRHAGFAKGCRETGVEPGGIITAHRRRRARKIG